MKIALVWAMVSSLTSHADRRARKLLDENRLEEAVAECRTLDSFSSLDTNHFSDCAWVYYRSGRIDAAEKLMDKLRANFGSPDFQLLSAYGEIAKKNYDKARAALDNLGKTSRDSGFAVRVSETKAELYEAMGNLGAAAFVYKDVIDKKPGSGIAHWGLGRNYLANGDMGRANTHLEKTTQLWPRHLASRFNLAMLATNREDDRDAAKWLAECYKLNKGDVGVLEQLGNLYERKGMFTDAIKFWQKALAINPKSHVANEKLNKYVTKIIDKLIEAKQFPEALEQIDALSTSKKTAGPVLLRRAIVYRNLGKYDKALADLLKYTSESPPDGTAFRELGICYVNLKRIDSAGANFLKASNVEPQEGMNWAWLAFTLDSKGEYKKARDAWRKAVDLIKDPAEQTKAARRLAALEDKLEKGGEDRGPSPDERAPEAPQQ